MKIYNTVAQKEAPKHVVQLLQRDCCQDTDEKMKKQQ